MKSFILRFLVSKGGSLLTPAIAALVAAAVTRVAALDPTLASHIDPAAVTGFLMAALVSVINYATNAAQSNGVKKIQAVVNVPADGYAGPVTYTEVRRALPNS